jgi:hypothetical protein
MTGRILVHARAIIDRFRNALADTLHEPAIKSRIEAMQIKMQIDSPDVHRNFWRTS